MSKIALEDLKIDITDLEKDSKADFYANGWNDAINLILTILFIYGNDCLSTTKEGTQHEA